MPSNVASWIGNALNKSAKFNRSTGGIWPKSKKIPYCQRFGDMSMKGANQNAQVFDR